MSAEKALAVSIGENALWKIDLDGLHALAVSMQDDGTCELVVVPEDAPTMEDVLEWEFETGELRLLFLGEADIELRIMDHMEYHELAASEEPAFNRHLAEA